MKRSRAIWLINHERWEIIHTFMPVFNWIGKNISTLLWLTWTHKQQYGTQHDSNRWIVHVSTRFASFYLHFLYFSIANTSSTPFGSSFSSYSSSIFTYICLWYFHFISFDFNRNSQNHCGSLVRLIQLFSFLKWTVKSWRITANAHHAITAMPRPRAWKWICSEKITNSRHRHRP